jgi:DNA-binding Lrp family transcriptional regulator
MDATDRQLLRLLRVNARLSISSLAASLGVSRGTAQARLDRLLAAGTIQGFTLRLKPEAEAAQVRAVALLEVTGGRMAHVVRALRTLPEVSAVHTTNGSWDLVVDLAADSLAEFDATLRRMRLIDGIARSETSLKLSAAG